MKINIINLQKKFPLNLPLIKVLIRKIIKLQNKTFSNLTIAFIRDSKIKKLNRLFLGKNSSTDVLSFDLGDAYKKEISGEIVISVDMAARNAKFFKTTFKDEIKLYIIHGILHLAGFNDKTLAQERLMRREEKNIMNILS